jgi:hypothetical protein
MILPHQVPIRFAQEIIEKNEEFTIVSCLFPFKPTLPMVSEAAAQSSAAFAQGDKPLIGFLISLKNIELISELNEIKYNVKIKKEISFGSMTEFSFELISNKEVCAKGFLTIALQDENL